ncbi:S8 family peptidase [Cognatiyoonia sp. IB215182]|uniref:S8 family peptidase n=1 Tax=Cognatiyoonia sp. IB215182 TaxID=3097353 RepID=UPI002A0AE433|nr:S8 family peptidase [Cognatiyoonia sp. IB215182]MDX8350871.1 S8 family peptidase [Cognatiyoonia sp. IB215182]
MFTGRIRTDILNRAINTPLRTVVRDSIADRVVAELPNIPPLTPDDTPGQTEVPGQAEGSSSGFIVIHLAEGDALQSLDNAQTLVEVAKSMELTTLAALLDEFDLGQGRRLVTAVSPSQLREMESAAQQSPFPPLRSLLGYWVVDARRHGGREAEIAKRLEAAPGVTRAYPQENGDDPAVNPANDPYNAQQGYLDAAPTGIDARWAWNQPAGCGDGMGVVDVERGWRLAHEDYVAKAPTLLNGDNRPGSENHGTAVLGEMIAVDNTVGVVGIANAATVVHASSYWDAVTNTSTDYTNAIVAAINAVNAGDCIILEIQSTGAVFGAPVEIFDDAFDATRLASALGRIVFEAAGNGTVNLDTLMIGGLNILNPASADFRDSGAIICGAAVDTVPHERANFSSFGARVNCYGWGQNVVTAGYGTLDPGTGPDDRYSNSFGGTSSATPIVTGAGMVVQAMHENATGARLSPAQMRLILSNPATGTPQGPTVAGNIGVMPNLRAILEGDLGLSADVYVRDNAGDDGSVPSTGGVSASPDVIVRPVAVADPQGSFGEGSGTENDATLGFQVEAGQDNFIYVRMRNRGSQTANNVTADVYWSEVSTLVTPDMWNLIGTTNPVNVPDDDSLVVTDGVTWAEADIPGPGHYCFVAILDHPADPAPVLPASFPSFSNFIRDNNNVAWRNFNVIDDIGDPDADPSIQDFLVANFPDQQRRVFDFVIDRRLPRDVRVTMDVPAQLAKPICGELDLECKFIDERQRAQIRLPSARRMVIPKVVLGSNARLKCRFIVEGLAETGRPGNSLSIGQFHDGQELGRVSWQWTKKRNPELLG